MSRLVLRMSSPGSVDLNSTAEQIIDVPLVGRARPPAVKVVLIDVIQDDPTVDTRALRWAPGYPVYDEASSTETKARVLVRFAIPAGVAASGSVRVLVDL